MGDALSRAKPITDAEHVAVVEAGGLHILGTERHESRRIDNQLRGRSGRQGDPGSSRFFPVALKTILCGYSRRAHQGPHAGLGMERACYRIRIVSKRIEGHRNPSKDITSPSQTPPRIRRCNEQTARDYLRLRRDL